MTNNKPQTYNAAKTLLAYGTVGFLFGACFPVGALVLESILKDIPLSLNSIRQFHYVNPLLYMIDSAPIWLGLFALIGGYNMVRAKKAIQTNEMRTEIAETEGWIVTMNKHIQDYS